MSVSEDDAQARADFEKMVRTAARNSRVTGLKFSLQQTRSGTYALLGAALVFIASALVSIFSVTLQAAETFRIEDLRMVAIIVYLLASGALMILFFLAQRNPILPSVVGLALYSVLLLPSVIIMGNEFWLIELLVLIALLLVLIALIDGVRAGIHHRRILRKALMSQEGAESQAAGK